MEHIFCLILWQEATSDQKRKHLTVLWTKKVIMFSFVGLNRFKNKYKRILALCILIKARAGQYIEFVRYILYNRYVIMKQYS